MIPMLAIRFHEFGPAENLRLEELPDPVPRSDQVRIAVHFAGVHLLDTTLRSGVQMGPFPLPALPAIPGREVAGVVDAVGPGVSEEWLGRRVVAHLGMASAGYAELALCNVHSLHHLPDHVAFDAAVAMIGTGRTAVGLFGVSDVKADDVVLITAAAGGVGSLLVQLCKNSGATVVGVAGGPSKTAIVKELGAIAVDYTVEGWDAVLRDALEGSHVSVVFDSVGGAAGRQAFDLLDAGGRFLMFGWSSGQQTQFTSADLLERSLYAGVALGPSMLKRAGGLPALERASIEALTAGRLTPVVNPAFSLANAAAAHEAVVGRSTVGKTVLKVR